MELAEIITSLKQTDYQYRLKAISALKNYPAETALPLLKQSQNDKEFLVRSFVARELGRFLTDESFAVLLEMMRMDDIPNVRAEAANSLSLFGIVSSAHLVNMFIQDDQWLVRRSILAALCDLELHDSVWEVACEAIGHLEDPPTREAAILALGSLAHTPQEPDAIALLTELSADPEWRVRQHVVYALKHFGVHPMAQDNLTKLREDVDHRVVAATLEAQLPG